ncbi:neutral alpha-glucosidase ab precursor [Emericellopsis atlantica]|uniref:alpha-glucosidase n=1 Tax=Emericellopsis atlantica TaxID=2614577 RepID=A0A9P7ZLB5_9HYPO|nr:neutral alpha-glucosidase ab precursor [Emericellopsis atlantica]KAG9253700.1 neutral alpha-glucosidase ab precursor [Emericellopsis atlantica]
MAPQRELIPTQWTAAANAEDASPSVTLASQHKNLPFTFSFETVRKNVFRTTFTSPEHPLPPHPSIQRPETSLDGSGLQVTPGAQTKSIATGDFNATIDWQSSSTPVVSVSLKGQDKPLHTDIPHRSYTVDGQGIAHYTRYNRGTLHVGLGEKAAPMNLSGRKFELNCTDSFGYDVYRTDPMYKNIPLLINATPQGCVAMFSTTHSRGSYSVGSEMDGMWGFYKSYRQDYGGLEEYVIVGKTLEEIVTTYAELAGFPLLVPRWAFGYLSGGMRYSMLDDPPASQALLEVARKLKEHDIPCSAHQLSSGYTIAEHHPKTRNVFTWNNHRFPDPKGFLEEYHRLGIRIIANIKPYVLASHPEYKKLQEAGALFKDPHTGETATTRLWSAGGGESGEGSHIDFTSEYGFKWWYDGVRELCRVGIDCMWNDNNEYTVTHDDWECALNDPSFPVPDGAEKRPQIGFWGRFVHTELHGKSSHDAMRDHAPDRRPFVLTRAATAGTMRYAASTWSGDNITSWAGMKGANALSLNAGMALMQCYGHDIGGFEGPQPSPELLLRWIQLGCHSPRFAINCFKTGSDNKVGDVIEPWMYPSITHLVRKAIKRRYAMIPYLYSLMLKSHKTAVPPQRWTGWGYEADPEIWTPEIMDGETQYWLGDALLVGGVYEAGESKARVYLPKASEDDKWGFLNLNAPYDNLAAGQWATIDAEWHGAGIPLLAKVGSAIPTGRDVQVLSPGETENVASLPLDDYRAVEIFPPPKSSEGKTWSNTWYEDDGVAAVEKVKISAYTIGYSSMDTEVEVTFERDESSGFVAPWKTLVVVLPSGDDRTVRSGAAKVANLGRDGQGRRMFELS